MPELDTSLEHIQLLIDSAEPESVEFNAYRYAASTNDNDLPGIVERLGKQYKNDPLDSVGHIYYNVYASALAGRRLKID